MVERACEGYAAAARQCHRASLGASGDAEALLQGRRGGHDAEFEVRGVGGEPARQQATNSLLLVSTHG